LIHLLGSQSFDGDGLVGGILGILVSTYSRPSDNLPVSATVVFDKVDFDFVKETGTIGMSLFVGQLIFPLLLQIHLRITLFFTENFILQQLIITVR
jgi:hypothetical protein